MIRLLLVFAVLVGSTELLPFQDFPICVADGWQFEPKVSGDLVVWEDTRNRNYEVYVR